MDALGYRGDRGGTQQWGSACKLMLHERRTHCRKVVEAGVADRGSLALRTPHDVESPRKTGRDQIALGNMVVVERTFGDVEAFGDLLHRGAQVALRVHQDSGGT